MIELRTLGSVTLQAPGMPDADAILRQPKRLALLAYLGVATPQRFERRDTLLGLFWPQLDEAHARNALGQTLHGLRTALGAGIVLSRGRGEVGLARERLWCDAAAFAEALEAGDRERALELYRGDMLEGFYLADTPEFERWLEVERTWRRRAAAEAAAWLAEDRTQAGDIPAAVAWALRASHLAPYDEVALCRLVVLLDRCGDRAKALTEYERFSRRIQQELEVEPSPETRALIGEVRARKEPLGGMSTDVPTHGPLRAQPAPEADDATTCAATAADPDDTRGKHPVAGRTAGTFPERPPSLGDGRFRGAEAVLALGASTIVITLAAAAWFARGQSAEGSIDIDPGVILVAPFRVAADPSLEYLREGLVDLIATSLNGETGSRAVDPRSTISAWRSALGSESSDLGPSAAEQVARELGAGQLLIGSVVGNSERLTLTASLHDAVRSRVRARVSLQGAADSLPALVDGLVGQLLALEAGVPRYQLAALTTTSLPALRSYLDGRSSYRRGRFGEAVAHLEEALGQDSTFALAALQLWFTAPWGQLTSGPGARDRALQLAWAARDRLGLADRLLLEAMAGPRYPEPVPRHELFAARTRALNAAPDRLEALSLMGLYHLGGMVRGEEGSRERGIAHYARALALDPAYAEAAHQVAREAAANGDAATVECVVRRYLLADSTSETAQLLQWYAAATSGDERVRIDLRTRMPAMHPTALGWIAAHAMMLGLDLDGAEAALTALRATVRSDRERRNHVGRELEYLGNRGRLGAVRSELEARAREAEAFGPIEELGMSAGARARGQSAIARIHIPVFWRGDTTGIGAAAAVLEDIYTRSPVLDGTLYARSILAESACFAGMARIVTGDAGAARAASARLRELLDEPLGLPDRPNHASCAATLDALIAVAEGRPDGRALAERADSMLRADPPAVRVAANRIHLLLARAFDDLGDHWSALRVIRRRELNSPPFYLATFLAEEGRLAALVGDHEGAIRAYRHYLALRTDPEPALAPEVERIREGLASLLASDPPNCRWFRNWCWRPAPRATRCATWDVKTG